MKKLFSSIFMLSVCAFALTSCSDDDDDNNKPVIDPVYKLVEVSNGAFVIGAGNQSANIGSNVTSYDYATNAATMGVFKTANGRELGLTANDAVVYGSKMYIIVDGEHTVEVVDKNTMKSIRQISTTELMGEDKGKHPRHGVAYDGKVFVSTYDGYVAAIDTTDYHLAQTYTAGSYPEGVAILDGYLYVANSDYSSVTNASISKIDLTTGEGVLLKDELITNPVGLAVVDSALYFLDYGTYDASWNQTGAGVRKIEGNTITKVADATMMATSGSKIYVCNAPYTYPSTVPTYGVYDTATGTFTNFTCPDVVSPTAIAADPVTGYLFVASYNKDPETGYASYMTNGYVVVYKNDFTKLTSFETGVGPTAITFNTNTVVYEE
jgi:hypothetical protein